MIQKWIPLVLLVVTSLCTPFSTAGETGNASISGKVTASNGGAPLGSILVSAYDRSQWVVAGTTLTQTDGSYGISGLSAGNYHIEFHDGAGNHVTEHYNDVTDLSAAYDSEIITLGQSSAVNGIDASLAPAGKITGRITGPDGTTPAGEIRIISYRWDDENEQWNRAGETVSSTDGGYSLGGLIAGDYRIRFTDPWGNYLGEYHDNAATLAAAADIVVQASSTVSNINASLEAAGKITGTVTAPDGVTPLPGIDVYVYQWNGDDESWESIAAGARTSANGTYTIAGLRAGNYRIGFIDNLAYYESEYYNDSPTVVSGQDITVPAATTVTGIHASLAESSRIKGTVTAQNGVTPLENIKVRAYYWNEEDGYWDWNSTVATTGPDGTYTLRGLDPRTYRLRFSDDAGDYLTEFHNNAPDVASAQDIPLARSASVTGINASLAPSGRIKGKVTGPDGVTALPGILITPYSWDGNQDKWLPGMETVSAEDGSYTIKGLAAGSHRVGFRDASGDYLSEFFIKAPDVESSASIEIGPSQIVSGINAALAQAGKITGTVTGPDGLTPLKGIHVDVFQWNWPRWEQVNGSETGVDGGYKVGGLVAGAYRVKFSDENGTYLTEYHQDSPTMDWSREILVGTAATVSGIDASLAEAGKISGKVTGPDGVTPLEGIQVKAYRWDSRGDEWIEYGDYHYSRSNGSYTISGLVTGKYRLRFIDTNTGEYISEYYDNAAGIDSATSITVGNPASVTGINASLGKKTSITGTVTGPDGTTPLKGIRVSAWYWDTGEEYWTSDESAYTSENGSYEIQGLPAGSYRIHFHDLKGDHVSEYHDNAADVTEAEDLVLAPSATISGIDASLAQASKITGTITGPDGVIPLAGIYVDSYQWNTLRNDWMLVGSGVSKSDGTYVTGSLSAGTYRLCISDPQGIHVAEYYNDVLDIGSAEDITVGNATTVSGMNASLSEGAKISGRVTTPSGASSLEGIQIQAYWWNASAGKWDEEKTTESGEDGGYLLHTLKPGIWRLGFHDYEDTYLTEYYNNTPDFSSATDIVISGTENITGINVSMNTEFTTVVKATLSGFRRTGPGAFEMDFQGVEGRYYQLQSSGNLNVWTDVGPPFMAGSRPVTIPANSSEARMFWRVRTSP